MNFYNHHIGDYDSDTSHLSWIEDCAYTRLIRLYYRRERAIPLDVSEACRLVRAVTPEQRRAVESVLNEFFAKGDDGWHQKRCDADISVYQSKAEHNRRAGKAGGRPRNSETQVVSGNNPDGFLAETQVVSGNNPDGFLPDEVTNPNQEPRTNNQEPVTKNQHTPPTPLSEAAQEKLLADAKKKLDEQAASEARFERFWSAYPKKADKHKARVAWHALKANEVLTAQIISAVTAKAKTEDWQKDGGKFIPLATTYLHGRRWEDAGVDLPEDGIKRDATGQVIKMGPNGRIVV